MPKKENYIDKKRLTQLVVDYKKEKQRTLKAGLPPPKLPEEIGESILAIARNLSNLSIFSGYSFREDMISDGVINCLLYIDNFDPEISENSFAYFTQIIKFAFFRTTDTEQKESYIKFKSLQNFESLKNNTEQVSVSGVNERAEDIITRFEEKVARKKEKRKNTIISKKNDFSLETFYKDEK